MNGSRSVALKISEEGFEGSIRDLFDDTDVEDRVPDHAGASGVSNSVSAGVSTLVK